MRANNKELAIKYIDLAIRIKPNEANYYVKINNNKPENYFNIEGVTLKGPMQCAGLNLVINASYSTFENSPMAVRMVPEHPSFIANNCGFYYLGDVAQLNDLKEFTARKCYFEGCGSIMNNKYSEDEDFVPKVNLDNDLFSKCIHSNGVLECFGCDVTIKHTTFDDVKMSNDFLDIPGNLCEINDCKFSNIVITGVFVYGSHIKISNCDFRSSKALAIINAEYDSYEVTDCLFQNLELSYSFSQPWSKGSVKKSTFLYNDFGSQFIVNKGVSFDFINNTVVGNTSKYQGFNITNPNFYNNTIIGNKFDGEMFVSEDYDEENTSTCNLYGNVFLGNATKSSEIGYNNLPIIKSDKKNIYYNLMPVIRSDYQEEGVQDNTTWIPDNNTNIFVKKEKKDVSKDFKRKRSIGKNKAGAKKRGF